ncbi:MAG: hypothetical protein WCK75_03725 [Elusimicrobiota bacterium]
MEKENNTTCQMRMVKRKIVFLLAVGLVCWSPGFLSSETLTMTTYYPAPYGGYASILTTGLTLLARDGGNVGIGSTSPQAKLDIQSTTSGFLPPRMSKTQRDAMGFPPRGSVIYDLTYDQIEYWDGNSWISMNGSKFVGATTAVYAGAAVGGYAGGDAKCKSQYTGSRMCVVSDFVNDKPTASGWYSAFTFSASAGGAGGAIIHDCRGWTLDSYYGMFWDQTGSTYCLGPCMRPCGTPASILCCK